MFPPFLLTVNVTIFLVKIESLEIKDHHFALEKAAAREKELEDELVLSQKSQADFDSVRSNYFIEYG